MLVQRFLPHPTPLLAVPFFRKNSIPIVHVHATAFLGNPNPFPFLSLSTRPLLFSNSLCSLSISQAVLEIPNATEYNDEIDNDEIDNEGTDFGAEEDEVLTEGLEEVLEVNLEAGTGRESKRALTNLSVKEKKELASYAHSLGKKLKSQQVGKSGVTGTVITALIETLEANELLKLKIHNTCPGELDDVVKQLEEGTGSVVVGQIGRTVILYRPSLTKMKAEEKKNAQRIRMRNQSAWKQPQSKLQLPRQSGQTGRGRRGSSRFGA